MAFQVNVTWQARPGSIWAELAKRLGREPTNAEATAEVKRILRECTASRLECEARRKKHQRR